MKPSAHGDNGMVCLDYAHIEKLKTDTGSFCYKVLHMLGVEFRRGQPQSWRHQITGTYIPRERYDAIFAARNDVREKTLRKRDGKHHVQRKNTLFEARGLDKQFNQILRQED